MSCEVARSSCPGPEQEPWQRQQNQAGRRKPTKFAEAFEKNSNHRAALGDAGMAQPIQKTAYIYESSGMQDKNKVACQILVRGGRFVRNRRPGLPSNQLQ